jgi:FixJ family two-component response regulator
MGSSDCETSLEISKMASGRNVIAIVDDDPQLLDALGVLLSVFGYRTELFTSAAAF